MRQKLLIEKLLKSDERVVLIILDACRYDYFVRYVPSAKKVIRVFTPLWKRRS